MIMMLAICVALQMALAAALVVPAMMSTMGFDAPGSSSNPAVWIAVFAMIALPAILGVGAVMAVLAWMGSGADPAWAALGGSFKLALCDAAAVAGVLCVSGR
jgi:hypothetical protein